MRRARTFIANASAMGRLSIVNASRRDGKPLCISVLALAPVASAAQPRIAAAQDECLTLTNPGKVYTTDNDGKRFHRLVRNTGTNLRSHNFKVVVLSSPTREDRHFGTAVKLGRD